MKARLARAAAPEPKTPPEPEVPTVEETAPEDAPLPQAGDPVAVRRLLLDLAKELATAESKAEVIEVMARLDDYVAEIMEAARGRRLPNAFPASAAENASCCRRGTWEVWRLDSRRLTPAD